MWAGAGADRREHRQSPSMWPLGTPRGGEGISGGMSSRWARVNCTRLVPNTFGLWAGEIYFVRAERHTVCLTRPRELASALRVVPSPARGQTQGHPHRAEMIIQMVPWGHLSFSLFQLLFFLRIQTWPPGPEKMGHSPGGLSRAPNSCHWGHYFEGILLGSHYFWSEIEKGAICNCGVSAKVFEESFGNL